MDGRLTYVTGVGAPANSDGRTRRRDSDEISLLHLMALLTAIVSSAALARPALLRVGFPMAGRRIAVRMMASTNDQGVEYSVKRTDAEWREQLAPEEFYVLRQKGTERPGSGEYNKFYPKDGHFVCSACAQPLYTAAAKFDSGCAHLACHMRVPLCSLCLTRAHPLCTGAAGRRLTRSSRTAS